MNSSEAEAVNELFNFLMPFPGDQRLPKNRARPTSELAMDAARFLATQAHRRLNHGWYEDDVCQAWDYRYETSDASSPVDRQACQISRYESILKELFNTVQIDESCSLEAQAGDAIECGQLYERARIRDLLRAATGKLKRPLSKDEIRFAALSGANKEAPDERTDEPNIAANAGRE